MSKEEVIEAYGLTKAQIESALAFNQAQEWAFLGCELEESSEIDL
jgi:uncharacterized protein (DUF433 family)